MSAPDALELVALSCGYGHLQAVHALDLVIPAGQVLALVGANGAGKTSTLMAIAGHVAVQGGTVSYRGRDITHATPQQRLAAGIALVPEGRRLFPDLSVVENLRVGGFRLPAGRERGNRERVLSLFPRLGERLRQRAGTLSGGEQQMLAIARALMSEPELILVDELSLGLMPKAVDACYAALTTLREQSLSILLVEQNTQRALEVADSVCVLESGRSVWRGSAPEARADPALIDAYLGMGAPAG